MRKISFSVFLIGLKNFPDFFSSDVLKCLYLRKNRNSLSSTAYSKIIQRKKSKKKIFFQVFSLLLDFIICE